MTCITEAVSEFVNFPKDAIAQLHLPIPISIAVTCIHLGHFVGRAISRVEARQQHPELYVMGILMNARYGDMRFLKVTAQIIHIARILFATIEEGRLLMHSCKRLADAFSPPKIMVLTYEENRLLSKAWKAREGQAPDFLFLPTPLALMAANLATVIIRIIEICCRIWKLNLCLMEVYDAVYINPYEQSTNIDDMFINLKDVANQCLSPERSLAHAVQEYQPWIDQLLHLIKIDWTAEKLIATLHNFADQSERMIQACGPPWQVASDMAQSTLAITMALMKPPAK